MRKQIFATKDKLKETFLKAQEKLNQTWTESEVISAIESISQAIKDLKDTGLNISLELFSNPSEDAFNLVRSGCDIAMTVPISGILKLQSTKYLLALSVSENNEDVLNLYLSRFHYPGEDSTKKIRGTSFDLKNDEEAIFDFQGIIIDCVVRGNLVQEHDICHSFENKQRRLPKKTTYPLSKKESL